MYTLKLENPDEIVVVSKALKLYKDLIERNEKAEEFLKTKKYKMGDYVTVHGPSNAINILNGEIGKIVGWDFEYDLYRVYYDDSRPYIGNKEEYLEKSEAIPEVLYKIDPMKVRALNVHLG